eukprot:7434378-Ditylum_brightwellii.AAC.2
MNQNERQSAHYIDCGIGKFSDLICHPLGAVYRGWFNFPKQQELDDVPMSSHLEKMTDKDSAKNRPPI